MTTEKAEKTAALRLHTQQVAAVAKWTSSSPSLAHLQYVVFRRREMFAADGHRCVRVPLEMDKEFDVAFGIHRDVITAMHHAQMLLQRALPESDRCLIISTRELPTLTVDVGGDVRFVFQTDFSAEAYAPIEATDELFRADSYRANGDLSGYYLRPEYLEALAEIHRATPNLGMKDQGMRVVSWSADRLGQVVLKNEAGVQCAIMPIRGATT